jgi:hypothetical protein
MKKLLLLPLILFFLNSNLTAQDLSYAFINLSAGPSFPFNDFSADDPLQSKSGFATVGIKAELTGCFFLTPQIGLMLATFTNINPTNPQKMTDYLNANYTGANWSIDSKNWEIYGLMSGLNYRYYTKSKFSFEVRITAGMMFISSPELLFRANSGLGTDYEKIEKKQTNALTYKISGGMDYTFARNFAFTGNAEFIGAKPTFSNVKTTTSIEGKTTTSTTSFDQLMSAFNVSIGLKYLFK